MIGKQRKFKFSQFIKPGLQAVVVWLKRPVFKPLSSFIFLFYRTISHAIGEWLCRMDSFFRVALSLIPNTTQSNPVSKLMRPWFEHQRVRGIFGVNLILALALVGFTGVPASATFPSGSDASSLQEAEISVKEAPKEVVVSTEKRFQIPVELIGVSQGFLRHHPGVDLRAAYGSDIRSIAEGVVLDVYRSRYGYGQAVVIGHADGYSSMYAHVQRIAVEAGSNVDQETVIAKIGMTGYTTGPHLHLEVYKEGKVINPRPILGY